MDLTESAINKIEKLTLNGLIVDANDRKWTAKGLEPVIYEPTADPQSVYSLTGFIDFVNTNIDKEDLEGEYLTVVEGVRDVKLISKLTAERRQREPLLYAEVDEGMTNFPFNKFLDREDFMIKFHSLFQKKDGDDFDYVSSIVSKIKQADEKTVDDDGISQTVMVKKGVSGTLVDKELVKPIVKLSPYRTFREIEQPESQFLLRIETRDNAPVVALFEADGGAWRNTARLWIAEYLKSKIKTAVIA